MTAFTHIFQRHFTNQARRECIIIYQESKRNSWYICNKTKLSKTVSIFLDKLYKKHFPIQLWSFTFIEPNLSIDVSTHITVYVFHQVGDYQWFLTTFICQMTSGRHFAALDGLISNTIANFHNTMVLLLVLIESTPMPMVSKDNTIFIVIF